MNTKTEVENHVKECKERQIIEIQRIERERKKAEQQIINNANRNRDAEMKRMLAMNTFIINTTD